MLSPRCLLAENALACGTRRLTVRRYSRRDIDLRLDIALCRTLNVSGSGILAVCPNTLPLHVGEIVQVLLHLPSGPPVAAAARVMRAGRDALPR